MTKLEMEKIAVEIGAPYIVNTNREERIYLLDSDYLVKFVEAIQKKHKEELVRD